MTWVSPRRATHFLGVKSKQNRFALAFGPSKLGFAHAVSAPWARCDGPSMALRSFRDVLSLSPLHKHSVRPPEGLGRGASYAVLNKCVLALKRASKSRY